jgi:hypothetical protein
MIRYVPIPSPRHSACQKVTDMSTPNTTPRTESERHPAFWSSPVDVQEMAAQQGVIPVENIDELRGEFWPEWESMEEFDEMVRQWRHEED